MKNLTIAISIMGAASLVQAAPVCPTAALTTYLNGGAPYACTESGGALTVSFQHDLLPSYIGLNLLSSNNSAANPAQINVVPGNPGFDFESSTFMEATDILHPLGAQSELVHFLLDAGTRSITSTTFALDNVATASGGLGVGLAVGQELLCVGGTFTSLPTGLVTSVTNGLLGTGAFGCNGTALIGTVADHAGLLSVLSGALGLPDLTGLTDQVTIQLSPVNASQVDVIKLQALVGAAGGSASDTGFGNTYSLSSATATPEPGSSMLMLAAGVLLAGNRFFGRRLGRLRRDHASDRS